MSFRNGLLSCLVFLLLLGFRAHGHADDSPPDRWLQAHTFTGQGKCLALDRGQRLQPGETVLVIDRGKRAHRRRVTSVMASDQVERTFKERDFQGVYDEPALWDSIGCWWGLRADDPRVLARLEGEELGLPVAIQGLPRSVRTAGGDATPLRGGDVMALARLVRARIPDEFRRAGVLRAGFRYGSAQGTEITEVLLGRPYRSTQRIGAPIDSIEILHVFLHNGSVLATNRFWRFTGVEERIDTEAPELDDANWHEAQDETLGYFSLDEGVSWRRITVNRGVEGVVWTIDELRDQPVQLWNHYLYTPH